LKSRPGTIDEVERFTADKIRELEVGFLNFIMNTREKPAGSNVQDDDDVLLTLKSMLAKFANAAGTSRKIESNLGFSLHVNFAVKSLNQDAFDRNQVRSAELATNRAIVDGYKAKKDAAIAEAKITPLYVEARGDEKTKKSIRDTIITTATDHIDTEKDQAIQDINDIADQEDEDLLTVTEVEVKITIAAIIRIVDTVFPGKNASLKGSIASLCQCPYIRKLYNEDVSILTADNTISHNDRRLNFPMRRKDGKIKKEGFTSLEKYFTSDFLMECDQRLGDEKIKIISDQVEKSSRK